MFGGNGSFRFVPMKTLIAVVGGGEERRPEILAQAARLGKWIAEAGCVLVTGGMSGVMEAASQGAAEAGGEVVGVLPGRAKEEANHFVTIAIPTGLREARNAVIATAADAIVAVGGEYGTLSEIALGLKLGKPVIAVASPWSDVPGVQVCETAAEAIVALASMVGRR